MSDTSTDSSWQVDSPPADSTPARGAYIGAGALIREKRTVVGGPSSVWSAVTKNIAPAEVWAGTPARFFRKVALPGDLRTPIGAAVTG